MKEKKKAIALRSEQVQEILNATPNTWMLYGNTIILMITLGFFLVSYFIRYPRQLSVPLEISKRPAAEFQTTRASGVIGLIFQQEGALVEVGTPLAVIRNAADYQEVNNLKQRLSAPLDNMASILETDPDQLGELKNDFLLMHTVYRSYGRIHQMTPGQLELLLQYTGRLQQSISAWEHQYVVSASAHGRLTYLFFDPGHYFPKGEALFSISPVRQEADLATIRTPDAYGRSLRLGQSLSMSIGKIPVVGQVVKKTQDTATREWSVYLELSEDTLENYPEAATPGSATLVLEDTRLLDRFISVIWKTP